MIFLLAVLSTSFAEEPMYANLKQGEPAPFDGRLLNSQALSTLIVDSQFKLQECDLQIEYQKSMLETKKQYEYDLLKASCEAQKQKYVELLDIRDQQVKDLEKLVKPRSVWRDAGSFILGAAIAVGIVYAVTPAFDE